MKEETLTNVETFIKVYQFTLKKAQSRLSKTFLLGVMAGIFVGIAYIGAIMGTSVWPPQWDGLKRIVFALIFTLAMFLVLFIGGEIFTANSMMFLSVVKGQTRLKRLLANLSVVLLGNFVGCFLLGLLTYWAGFIKIEYFAELNADYIYNHFGENLKKIINSKLNNITWYENFFSAILCNILVSGSVYVYSATKNSSAKFSLVGLVIAVFATAGFSHIVANAYFWGLSIYTGGISKFWEFTYSIQLPTLFGNFIGGNLLIGTMYLIFKKELPAKIDL